MPGYDLFEYAVIRWVPRVEREEFLNIGVVLYCRQQQFLEMMFTLERPSIATLAREQDMLPLIKNLNAFQELCEGVANTSLAVLPIAERFRWLTSTRSTILQVSKVHPGLCKDPREKLIQLFNELVQ